MRDGTIQRVGVVGAGTIGASWAAYFLSQSLDVVVADPSPQAPDLVRRTVESSWPLLERIGLTSGASPDRITFLQDGMLALGGVDFVQESGPEREDLKIELFQRLDAATEPDVIIASSSSGLLMSQIQSACRHPERCLIGHPFNPPHLVPLVEVVSGRQTSAESVRRAMAFYAAIGKHPIHLQKEVSGHVANRLQAALWREAVHLYLSGVASISDIDAAVTLGPGMRWALMGPSLTFHLGGGEGGIGHFLDHLSGPMQTWWDNLGAPDLTPAVKTSLKSAIEQYAGTRSVAEMTRQRDAFLLELRALNRRSCMITTASIVSADAKSTQQ